MCARKATGFRLNMETTTNREQLTLREDEAEVWRQSVKAARRGGESKLAIDEAGVKPGEKGAKGTGEPIRKKTINVAVPKQWYNATT